MSVEVFDGEEIPIDAGLCAEQPFLAVLSVFLLDSSDGSLSAVFRFFPLNFGDETWAVSPF